jgi:hypothetical protein
LRQENLKNTDNPTVWNRLARYRLNCAICPPHKNENQKCHKKHGVRKPRTRIRRTRTEW